VTADPAGETDSRFHHLFERAGIGIAQIDTAGRYLLVNERYCELLGRARRSNALGIVGRRLVALDHRDRAGFQGPDRAFEQAGFTAAGGAHQVDSQHPTARQPRPVQVCQRVILRENARLELDVTLRVMRVMIV
jgi:PAS domain-containing protein